MTRPASARDQILAAIRGAVAGASTAPTPPRTYRDLEKGSRESILDLFATRVEEYRAAVTRVGRSDLMPALISAVGGRSVVVPPDLPWPIPDAIADDDLTSTELDGIEAVVTGAAAAVAKTGTIVLDHGSAQGRRALSLVPDVHICVVRSDQVVSGVPELMSRLDPGRPTTWISGPSATSDIELSRVEGVHGPRTLLVILVDAEGTA